MLLKISNSSYNIIFLVKSLYCYFDSNFFTPLILDTFSKKYLLNFDNTIIHNLDKHMIY